MRLEYDTSYHLLRRGEYLILSVDEAGHRSRFRMGLYRPALVKHLIEVDKEHLLIARRRQSWSM